MRLALVVLLVLGACGDKEVGDTDPEADTDVIDEPCAEVGVSASGLEWGGVRIEVATGQELGITNTCDEVVVVDASVSGDAAFSLPDDSITLAAGATGTLEVEFTAPDGDSHEGTLVLSPHGGEEVEVLLEGLAEPDWDGDGYEDVLAGGADCDDDDPDVNPGAAEVCNGVDDDCDGTADDLLQDWYDDADGDGWGAGTAEEFGCSAPSGWVTLDGDCDDADPTVFPGAAEVACDGIDQDCDGSMGGAAMIGSTEYTTIQDAIDDASTGDEVGVCPGTWTEGLAMVAKDITLTSVSGDPTDTILDGEDTRQILTIDGGTVTVSHLGFTRGNSVIVTSDGSTHGDGGAITAMDVEILLEDCIFTDSQAGGSGGAVVLGFYSGAVLESSVVDCTFEGNIAGYSAGGLLLAHGGYDGLDVTVSGCTFEDNESGYEGGGLTWGARDEATITIEDTTFTANFAEYSGGGASISGWDPSVVIIDGCTFDSNESDYEGGGMEIGSWAEGDDVTITDTAFIANHSRSGGGVELATWGWATMSVTGSTFSGNTAEDGAATSLGSWATWMDVSFTETTFDGNTATRGASVFTVGSRIESCAVVYDACTIVSNTTTAGSWDGAVSLPTTCDLESIDTDWGTGTTDNSPYDLCSSSGCDSSLGAGESFTCTAGSC